MRVFDSHAHLDEPRFDADRAEILAELAASGSAVMNVGCDLASSSSSLALANASHLVYAAVGSHPDAADQVTDAVLEQYRTWCRTEPKVRAIGEIGLDYHYEDVPRAIQREAFAKQLTLAQELQMPVIVHEREAHGDGLEIISRYPSVTGVFHCYSGSVEMAKQLVARGWYIGFTGVITFKNARRAVEVAEYVPLARILIETDCPYMAPEPYRGKRCDPRLVVRMAEKIAEIKGISPEEAARATWENACRLFRLAQMPWEDQ